MFSLVKSLFKGPDTAGEALKMGNTIASGLSKGIGQDGFPLLKKSLKHTRKGLKPF